MHEILARLDQVIQKHLTRLIESHGTNVGLSVASNLGITLIAVSMLMIDRHGGDPDDFFDVLKREINEKFGHISSSLAANEAILNAMGKAEIEKASKNQPMH
ncbi:hypothetical protein UFOVP239_19 [uncultured Caudovirales phage]|uniref:Uncharacterized protein n=1 Tax=uncultured Caudovirales phage TaxID=2100421 RepID=A0A6J7WPQ8_9CAUD|nr:hypothetical protein UFOVP239_19 [uncultured Caudovirales phage]